MNDESSTSSGRPRHERHGVVVSVHDLSHSGAEMIHEKEKCTDCGTPLSGAGRYCERCRKIAPLPIRGDLGSTTRPRIGFESAEPLPAEPPRRSRRRALVAGVGALALTGAVAGVVLATSEGGSRRPVSLKPKTTDPVVTIVSGTTSVLPTTSETEMVPAPTSSTVDVVTAATQPAGQVLTSPVLVATTNGWLRSALSSIAVGPGNVVVTGTARGESFLWDAVTGEPIFALDTLDEHGDVEDSMVGSAAVNRNGSLVLTGSHDGWLRLWDISGTLEGNLLSSWRIGSYVRGVTFSPTSDDWAAVTSDGGVFLGNGSEIGDVCDGARCFANFTVKSDLYTVSFSPDGQRLVVGGTRGLARLVDLRGFSQVVLDVPAGDYWVLAAAFDPSGNHIAISGGSTRVTSTDTGRLWLWDVSEPSPRLEKAQRTHSLPVFSIDFSQDGQYLLTASQDGTAIVWDWEEPRLRSVVTLDAQLLPSGERCWMNGARFTLDGTGVVGACGKLDWDGFGVTWRFRESETR